MPNFLDLSGKRFNKWTVQSFEKFHDKNRESMWRCRCDCGKESVIPGYILRSGKSKSCLSCSVTIHGKCKHKTRSRAYSSWIHMNDRCNNPNHESYKYYGGRGILICDEWKSFDNFLRDMGEPLPGETIDRINVNGNYSKTNCRWATPMIQSINQRTRSDSETGYKGVHFYKSRKKWTASIKTKGKAVHLGYFSNLQDAIDARKEAEEKYHRPIIDSCHK